MKEGKDSSEKEDDRFVPSFFYGLIHENTSLIYKKGFITGKTVGKKVNLLFVGCSKRGKTLLELLLKMKDVNVAASCGCIYKTTGLPENSGGPVFSFCRNRKGYFTQRTEYLPSVTLTPSVTCSKPGKSLSHFSSTRKYWIQALPALPKDSPDIRSGIPGG